MERLKDPNKGLMSPPGGKLIEEIAETPAECAAREGFEECKIISKPEDWKLMGIISEKNFPGIGNIMIFLMEQIIQKKDKIKRFIGNIDQVH